MGITLFKKIYLKITFPSFDLTLGPFEPHKNFPYVMPYSIILTLFFHFQARLFYLHLYLLPSFTNWSEIQIIVTPCMVFVCAHVCAGVIEQ